MAIATDTRDLDAMRAQWTQLYCKTLPASARARDPAQPTWPVTLDHCFARIILDNTVGRGVLQWDNVIKRPAVRNMDEAQLQAAIELGEKIRNGQVNLVELDKQSLKARGKNEQKYRKPAAQPAESSAVKRERPADKNRQDTQSPKRQKQHQPDGNKRQATISFVNRNNSAATNTNSNQTQASTKQSANPNDNEAEWPNPNLRSLLHKIDVHPSLTPYRKRLYSTLLSVPAGQYTTYASMASYLSSSPRAVGNGMRNNPFAPDVPCHRVLAADGTLGGFGGYWGVEGKHANKKVDLLSGEGVKFDSRGKVKGMVFGGLRDMREVMEGEGLEVKEESNGN